MTKIATGEWRKWFATAVTGDYLPCLKAQFWNVRTREYHEPHFYDPKSARNVEYIDAVKQGTVLVSPYKKLNGKDARDGYSGVFKVEDVRHDETGLRCRIVRRVL